MGIERLIPSSVYERLPNGTVLKETYSQVVRATGMTQVHLAGTLSVDTDGDLVGKDDMQAQTSQIMDNIQKSLEASDASMDDVVRITIYTVDVDRFIDEGVSEVTDCWEDGKYPTDTLVGVERLADPDFLVEISATAVVE